MKSPYPGITLLGISLLAACASVPTAVPAQDSAAQAPAAMPASTQQTEAAVAVVEQFAAAIKAGDRERTGALLADDVLILESGKAQRSRAEYLGGHAVNDAAFLQDAQIRITQRTARVEGDLAWVATESELQASQDGKPMTRLSSETMVLKNTPAGWRIVHIHWSSRPKP
uniref:Tnp n=1 Tax=uncultured Lysobacteraceae bacterium TaxID=211441 RepID=J9UX06_9GAMM|nr:Tnp [uncultured Xanthomonadaceae bacterium]